MRAVTMERGHLQVTELPDLVPGKGEVLVKSCACGICGSDLHAVQHTEDFVKTSREAGGGFKLTTFNPVVLGHEFCAEVVDYGPGTEGRISPGKLVCSPPAVLRDPMQSVGYSDQVPGGFSEYMLLSESMIVPVPAGTDADMAALTEPMAVGLHGVNMARLQGGEAIVVIGCGPVGLALITVLRQRGVGPIVAADFSPGRRALAEKIGAHVVIDPAETSPYQHPDFASREEHVVFECVGVPGMLDGIFLAAPDNTRIMVLGVCLQTDHIRPLIAINKELNVQFLLGWTIAEFHQSLQHIADGTFDVAPLITDRVSLDKVPATFAALATPNAQGKVVVRPWDQGASRHVINNKAVSQESLPGY